MLPSDQGVGPEIQSEEFDSRSTCHMNKSLVQALLSPYCHWPPAAIGTSCTKPSIDKFILFAPLRQRHVCGKSNMYTYGYYTKSLYLYLHEANTPGAKSSWRHGRCSEYTICIHQGCWEENEWISEWSRRIMGQATTNALITRRKMTDRCSYSSRYS